MNRDGVAGEWAPSDTSGLITNQLSAISEYYYVYVVCARLRFAGNSWQLYGRLTRLMSFPANFNWIAAQESMDKICEQVFSAKKASSSIKFAVKQPVWKWQATGEFKLKISLKPFKGNFELFFTSLSINFGLPIFHVRVRAPHVSSWYWKALAWIYRNVLLGFPSPLSFRGISCGASRKMLCGPKPRLLVAPVVDIADVPGVVNWSCER